MAVIVGEGLLAELSRRLGFGVVAVLLGCSGATTAGPSGRHPPPAPSAPASRSASSPTSPSVDALARARRAGCPPPSPTVVRLAPGTGRTVALTFDDGPSTFTPDVLRVLRRYDVRATFFDTGAHDAAFPSYTRALASQGLVENHTWEHRYPSQVHGGWSAAYLTDQLGRTNRLQAKLTGRTDCFFRPPGGFTSPALTAVTRRLGLSVVLWSVDTLDWQQPRMLTSAATARIVARAEALSGLPASERAHPILLMHLGKASHEPESQVSSYRGNTVAALPQVIRWYQQHGYRFVDLLSGGSGR
jgi:peptidoglycan-N-acetylglucosamine deacetylase